MHTLQNISIKKLSLNDLDAILMFHVEHSQNFKISENTFKNYLTFPQYTVFVAIIARHEIVGYIIVQKIFNIVDIIHVCVRTLFRRHGIATKLVLHTISSTENDIEAFLEVCVDNIEAIALYKKCGFCIATIRKKYSNSKDFYLMIKKQNI
jgi:ribosomal protein S18 acetylase RimI-like enzyme